jgi:thiol-disulfide isomerase/thioredoxin
MNAIFAAAALSLQLMDLHGKSQRLADYRGKVVLLNFWASWCDPCIEELPVMEKLREDFARKPFVILAVQSGGSARTAGDVVSTLKLGFPILLDRDTKVTQAFDIKTLPTTYLIGPSGEVIERHVGEWPQMRAAVEKLFTR